MYWLIKLLGIKHISSLVQLITLFTYQSIKYSSDNLKDNFYEIISFKQCCILIQLSSQFVLDGPTDKSALVQVMAWHRTGAKPLPDPTRTTKTPAFWDTPRRPMITHTRDSHQIQVKTRQSQSHKFKKIAKNSNIQILQETLHTTRLLKLLDKMCKHEMDPTRTVGVTERTWDAGWTSTNGQTDGRMDGRTDGVKPI